MRTARFLSDPKRLVSAFAGLSLLASTLVGCNAILGDFGLDNDEGDGGSAQDGAGGADGSSDSSTDSTTNPGQDAAADGEAANDSGGHPSDAGVASDAADSAVEAGPSCPTGQAFCSGSCIDILSAPGDCGGCGHACNLQTMYGGSSCQSGVCAPVAFIANVTEQFVDVGAEDGLVFVHVVAPDAGVSNISVCAADSCDNLTIFQQDPNPTANAMLASGGQVAWWTRHQGSWISDDGGGAMNTPGYAAGAGLLTMSLGGGNVGYLDFNRLGTFLNVNAVGGFSWTTSSDAGAINPPVSMDSANVAFLVEAADGGGSIETCSIASGCTSALPIAPATPFANVLTPYAYLGLPAPSNVDAGPTIAYVSLTPSGPPPAPSVLTRLAPSVSLVQTAIDSTGFYWLDSAGNISMCPIAPAACPTGGIPVVKASSPIATQFAVSKGFVFFLTAAPANDVVYEAEPPAL